MKKVTGTIVNQHYQLIGLEVTGTMKDFGEMGTEQVTKRFNIPQLKQMNFKNSEVEFQNGILMQKGTMKLKNLPMYMYNGSGFVTVDNTITLLSRIASNGEIVGYECTVAGETKKLKTRDIVTLTGLLKPTNFFVKFMEANKTAYLSANRGESLDNLPLIEIGQHKDKPTKEKAVDVAKNEVGKQFDKDVDIIELLNLVRTLNGKIIFLPTENYTKTTESGVKTDDSFISMGAGEIGNPYITPAEKSLNVNGDFNAVGLVTVPLSTGNVQIPTFTYKRKTIFRNGRNHIGKFGVAVDSSKEQELLGTIGKSLAIAPLDNERIAAPLRAFMNDTARSVRFFTIDTSNVELLSGKNVDNMMLSHEQLRSLTLDLLAWKSIYAFINGASKAAEAELAEKKEASARGEINARFKGLSEEDLRTVEKAGINIFTGAFTKTEKDESIKDAVEKESVAEKEAGWEVEYCVAGCSKAMSFKEVLEKKETTLVKKVSWLMPMIEDVVSKFEKLTNAEEIYAMATPLKQKCDEKKREIVLKLWLNNMARLKKGGYTKFVLEDVVVEKELKDSIAYKSEKVADLGVKISKGLVVG